ncbi:30S ribosomal protein S6 [Corynebacterium endometrii]|uniref:Small ribosomal subunit protein bS6 n=1 Tax=Corynebacterium endometrii TaxID=2488819 RepID=A0A4P7QKR7_9CORY|nr:30S ribosomal protein S6 [Corynebacterium endometrii]
MRSVRHYEVMIILDPAQDERTVTPSLDKFLETVRSEGGKVENVDVWGKRRLAYPINKKDEGIYAVVNLECESASVLELDRRLNLNDSILRTKVLRTDSK